MAAFYNEFEPFAAAWLRELIKAGEIADGEVSEKDMWDVIPSELIQYDQVHMCAGIGGWSAALRLAGWPDDRPVWTVSLPCQPFSSAGQGHGLADERGQLADAFFWLAGICRPVCIFGEQVEAAIKHDWLDVMASQLESIGYTVGAVGFPASSVGAYHIRQRLYWVAYSKSFTNDVMGDAEIRKNSKSCFWGLQSGRCYMQVNDFTWSPDRRESVESAVCSKNDVLPYYVGTLRGAGNTIVPQAAAEFIRAYLEI